LPDTSACAGASAVEAPVDAPVAALVEVLESSSLPQPAAIIAVPARTASSIPLSR
jgi:hypothetical protein